MSSGPESLAVSVVFLFIKTHNFFLMVKSGLRVKLRNETRLSNNIFFLERDGLSSSLHTHRYASDHGHHQLIKKQHLRSLRVGKSLED